MAGEARSMEICRDCGTVWSTIADMPWCRNPDRDAHEPWWNALHCHPAEGERRQQLRLERIVKAAARAPAESLYAMDFV